ncbi:MAG: sulfatase-like hydrolase/transferase, partial [Victivallales bacterium]|nr:sulfatase-like hydrolase/transferase [Victivallales bacterium]
MDHFPDRPNIIWILGDQHRAQAVGCLGNEQLATPHLDSLTDTPLTGIAGCPLCSPFRASMLASRWPHECVPGHDVPIPDATPMLTDPLRGNGYDTAYFGKWHVDGDRNREPGQRPAFQPVRRERRGGFDVWLGYENNNAQYD